MVLLAVVRPVVEYASTVWHTDQRLLAAIEAEQLRVLKRFVSVSCNVSSDVLHLEFGCRPYASWMAQRKLEYAVRLQRMPEGRLPSVVAGAQWTCAHGAKRPVMHTTVVQKLARQVPFDLAGARAVSAQQAKQSIAHAVRKHDVSRIQQSGRSAAARCVRFMGDVTEHPNKMQRYLEGPLTAGRRIKFMCRAGVLLTARRRQQMGAVADAACQHCRSSAEETVQHIVLGCAAYAPMRRVLWREVECTVGPAKLADFHGLPLDDALVALLGDHFWGDQAAGVDDAVQRFLEAMYLARQGAGGRQCGGPVSDPFARSACQVAMAKVMLNACFFAIVVIEAGICGAWQ
jgi:hypothetical protein